MLLTSEKKPVWLYKWDRLRAGVSQQQTSLLLAVAGVGILLRLFFFLDNRSLWIDELYLNGNLLKMGFLDLLTQPLDYQQKAPLGYLWMSKLAVTCFGQGEQALRLFSLLSGIGALVCFVPVARFFLKPWPVILAVSLLAIGEPFIYHATEAKQYSAELLASVLALYWFVTFHRVRTPAARWGWGIGGALLMWFSFSAIFVLAGIGLVVSGQLLLQRKWNDFAASLIPGSLWLTSFGLVYFLFLRHHVDLAWVKDFFERGCAAYLPVGASPAATLTWFAHTHYMLLEQNLGLLTKFGPAVFDDNIRDYSPIQTVFRMPLLPLLLELVGVVSLLRTNKYHLLLLTVPIVFTLAASAFQLYPFYERLILFLAPQFLLLICYGAQVTADAFKQPNRPLVAALLVVLLLFPPTWNAVRFSAAPATLIKKQYNREALLYANERYQEGDAVYVYWTMNQAYQYYKDAYHLKYDALGQTDIKHTTASKQEYYQQIRQQLGDLQGKKRLWIITCPSLRNNVGDFLSPHLQTPKWYYDPTFSPPKELEKVAFSLGASATPIDSFQRVNIDVKLYTLNP